MVLYLQKIIITRLLVLIFRDENLAFAVNEYLTFFNTLRKKSGLKYAIKYFKAVKLHCTRYMCGNPLRVSTDVRVSLKNGFPTRFPSLLKLLNDKKYRIVLSILTYTRSVVPNKRESKSIEVDYSTIIAPSKGVNIVIPNSFIKEFVDK
jgi:hypothetical protein